MRGVSVAMAACLWILIAVPLCVVGYTPNTVYLKKHCRSTYKFSRDVVLRYSPASTDFTKNYFCETTIRTTDLGRHLQLRFIFLDLKKSTDCNVARILITDTNNKTVLTPATGVCGTKRPSQLYRTSGNTVAVSLSTDSTPFNWGDFEILITSFYDQQNGTCNGNDFLCDNGICISNSLTCNGYNDCGDSSDEFGGICALAAGVIVGIVFGIIVFFIVLVVLGVCFRRRRRYYIRIKETAQPYHAVNVSSSGYSPSYVTQYN